MNLPEAALVKLSAIFDAARRDYALRHIKNRALRTELRKWNSRPEDFSERGMELYFHPYDCVIPAEAWKILRGIHTRLRTIKAARPDAQIEIKDGNLLLKVDGIKIKLTTVEEALIVEEVFVWGVYNFSMPGPCVVWDVGANVGISALFFSQMPHVAAVHAFEPFPDTAAAANVNFDLNPASREKIFLTAAGVAARHESRECSYNPHLKGSMSVTGPSPDAAGGGLEKRRVTLMPASEVLSSIMKAHPGLPIVAKIDCEGSEAEILAELSKSQMLKKISLVMIEWHDGTQEPVCRTLLEQGFSTICQVNEPGRLGLIYAAAPMACY